MLKEPSGNGMLDPNEIGQLIVAVVNTGQIRAKDVRMKLSTMSQLDGVTFGKDFSLGTIYPNEQKTQAVTISLISSKNLADRKGVINIEVTASSTNNSVATLLAIETTSGDQQHVQNISPLTITGTKTAFNPQQTPLEKLSPTVRQLRDKVAASPNDNITRLLLLQQYFQEKLYDDVIIECKKTIPTVQDRPATPFYLLGESYRQSKQYGEALQSLHRAYTLIKTPFPDLSTSYALTLLHMAKVHEAIAVLQEVAKIDSKFLDRRLEIGDAKFKENDFESAADEYLAVYVLNRTKLSQTQLSFAHAIIDFRSIAGSKDSTAATTSFVGNAKRKLGDSLDFDGLASTFAAMIASNQIGDALNLYVEILKLPGATMTQEILDKKFLAIGYTFTGDNPELVRNIQVAFIRQVKGLYGLDDEEVKPIYGLHDFVFKQGLVSSAAEITASLVGKPLAGQQKYAQLAGVFLRYMKNDDAVSTFGLMLKKKGLDKFAYAGNLSRMYAKLLREQKGPDAQDLMKRIELLSESDITATYSALAEILTGAGQVDESINILQALIQNDPANVSLGLKLGEAYLAKGRYDDIISSFLNIKTKDGRKYLALAYEKKYFLVEANRAWDEFRKLTADPKESADAKKHIDDNLIAMMSPDFARLKAEANKPKVASAPADRFQIVIDSPIDGFQAVSNSIEIRGKFVGAATLQDVTINGTSVGTPRGMKVVEQVAQGQDLQDSSKGGLPFAYVVSLNPGKNDIKIDAVSSAKDSATAHVSVILGAPVKAMTIEEADGIRQTKAYAVIIGIDKYKDPGIRGLNHTVNDAEELAKVLTDPMYAGFKKENVTLLVNADATTKNIKMAIGVDLKRAPEDGIAVVFFAGHGAPEGEKTYWLTYDADPNSLYASSLSNDEIADMLGRINTKRVVTFLDCCYSGASVTSSRSTRAVVVDDPFKSLEGAGSITITSSNGKEQSLEDDKLKHGIFTYRLLEAIKGKADRNADGIVMADEIAQYIKENVPNDARERSHKQDPVVVANYTGYIPISRNAENVLKNSKINQIQHFMTLYRNQKIDGATLKRIKDIIEGDDETAKQPIRDYFNQVFDLRELLSVLGK